MKTIIKRKFTLHSLFLSLMSMYVCLVYEINFMLRDKDSGYLWMSIVGIITILDLLCHIKDKNYLVHFSTLEKDYYGFSIFSFIMKIILVALFIVALFTSPPKEHKYTFFMLLFETIPIIISVALSLFEKIIGVETDRVEYRFEKK